ncbi:hypothetical protein CIB48_g6351 [Xylaria polymorpha]|nr:hypothetical protein CIB48_g6351 [Xylaria polymorpha]
MTSEFAYSSLVEPDHIRLLLLQPTASRDDGLVGFLHHISLNDQYHDLIDPYTALSYVWGDPTPVDTILLDGKDVGITANLGVALRDLRDVNRTHRVWADALCIDQRNIPERNQQVTLMGHIYSRANYTAIYLGALTSHAEIILQEVNRGISLPIFGSDAESCPSSPELILDAANEGLLSQPWFNRVWVLQELVFSREPWVQFGVKRIRWTDLCHLLIPLLKNARRARYDYDSVTILENMNRIRPDYWKAYYSSLFGKSAVEIGENRSDDDLRLWHILDMRKDCGVTDPRDFIFAHMGMISDKADALKYIKVDYTQTTSEVFTAAGRYIKRRAGLKYLLPVITTTRPTNLVLPSWVPDWGKQIPQGMDEQDSRKKFSMRVVNSNRCEAFATHVACKILHVSSVLPPSSVSAEDFRQTLTDYLQKLTKNRRVDYAWQDIVDYPWEEFVDVLITAGVDSIDYDGVPLRSWSDHVEFTPGALQHHLVPPLRSYLHVITKGISPPPELRLAVLNSGAVIFVPREALSGDVVTCLTHSDLSNPPEHIHSMVIVRQCAPPKSIDFELEYVSNYVATMVRRYDIGDSADDKILFLHGFLVKTCKGFTCLGPEWPNSKNAMSQFVDGWSAHDVAGKLGRRASESSSRQAGIIVLH